MDAISEAKSSTEALEASFKSYAARPCLGRRLLQADGVSYSLDYSWLSYAGEKNMQ